VDGLDADDERYNYKNDPGERVELTPQSSEKVEELKKMWLKESQAFLKPCNGTLTNLKRSSSIEVSDSSRSEGSMIFEYQSYRSNFLFLDG
jgi:hypothetical protein